MASKKYYIDLVTSRYKYLQNQRKNLEEHWFERCFRKYYLSRDYTDEELFDIEMGIKSSIKLTTEMEYIQTKSPRVMSRFFNVKPIVKVLPNDKEAMEPARKMETSLDKDFRDHLFTPMDMSMNQCLMYGTGILTHGWLFKKEADNLIDRVFFDWVDLYGFYILPTYMDIQVAPYCIRRILKPLSYLKANCGKGKIYNETEVNKITGEELSEKDEGENYLGKRLQVLRLSSSKGSDEGSGKGDKKLSYVELLEHWENDRVMTVANRKYSIRNKEDNPFKFYKPFFGMRDYVVPECFYGLGEIDVLADGPRYAEDQKNMRIDIEKRVAYPAVIVGKGAMVDPEDLVSRPAQVVRATDIEQVREFAKADVKRSLFMEENIANSDMENKTGLYSYLKGGYAPRGETATTTSQMMASGDERINKMIISNAISFLKPLAEKTAILKIENTKKGVWHRFTQFLSLSFEELTGEKMQGDFSFEPTIVSAKTISDIALQQQILGIYDRLAKSPTVSRYGIDKFLCDAFDIPDTENILADDKEAKILQLLRENPDMIDKILMLTQGVSRMEASRKAMGAGGAAMPVEAIEAGGPPEGMALGGMPLGEVSPEGMPLGGEIKLPGGFGG